MHMTTIRHQSGYSKHIDGLKYQKKFFKKKIDPCIFGRVIWRPLDGMTVILSNRVIRKLNLNNYEFCKHSLNENLKETKTDQNIWLLISKAFISSWVLYKNYVDEMINAKSLFMEIFLIISYSWIFRVYIELFEFW